MYCLLISILRRLVKSRWHCPHHNECMTSDSVPVKVDIGLMLNSDCPITVSIHLQHRWHGLYLLLSQDLLKHRSYLPYMMVAAHFCVAAKSISTLLAGVDFFNHRTHIKKR